MKIVKEFSRFAEEYNRRNIIQLEVAKRLTNMILERRYPKILDLGAGTGAIFQNLIESNIEFDKFVAFDFSEEMLNLHPLDSRVDKICADFNHADIFKLYGKNEFNLLISSSALQWSNDLESVLEAISSLSSEFYLSFFTSQTFKTLHQIAKTVSPIHSKELIEEKIGLFFDYSMEVVEYKLNFDSVQEMFRYIKKSGVNGGATQLTYKQIKEVIALYPLDYLEFEVVFIKARGRG